MISLKIYKIYKKISTEGDIDFKNLQKNINGSEAYSIDQNEN